MAYRCNVISEPLSLRGRHTLTEDGLSVVVGRKGPAAKRHDVLDAGKGLELLERLLQLTHVDLEFVGDSTKGDMLRGKSQSIGNISLRT